MHEVGTVKKTDNLTALTCPFIAANIKGDIPSLLPVLGKTKSFKHLN